MWTLLLAIMMLLWLGLSLLAFIKVTCIINKYKNIHRLQVKDSWNAFIRHDFNQWNTKVIKLGCFITFPFKFFLLSHFLILTLILVYLTRPLGNLGKKIFRTFGRTYGVWIARRLFTIIQNKSLDDHIIKSPMIVSNHVCWFDIFFLITRLWPVSFVAKDTIEKLLLVGTIATFAQTIYLQRSHQLVKEQVIGKIKKRIEQFELSQKKQEVESVYPLIVFPQATTSNGNSLLKFKMGAFSDLAPLTLFCLKYTNDGFDLGMDEITQGENILISLCMNPKLEVTWTEVKANYQETPLQYNNRCRAIISEIGNFKMYDCNFQNKNQYAQLKRQEQKKIK